MAEAEDQASGGGEPLLGGTAYIAPGADGYCCAEAAGMIQGDGGLAGILEKSAVEVVRIALIPDLAAAYSDGEVDTALAKGEMASHAVIEEFHRFPGMGASEFVAGCAGDPGFGPSHFRAQRFQEPKFVTGPQGWAGGVVVGFI